MSVDSRDQLSEVVPRQVCVSHLKVYREDSEPLAELPENLHGNNKSCLSIFMKNIFKNVTHIQLLDDLVVVIFKFSRLASNVTKFILK